MIRYRHRQVGTLVLCIGGAAIVLLGSLLVFVLFDPIGAAVLAVLLVCFGLFSTLTVEVSDTDVRLRFGPGLVRRAFPLRSIRRASAVRNRWFYGWGIRVLPRGRLYNVSGLDAIELEMVDGSAHRIGTDEPARLLAAIGAAGIRRG